MECMFYVVAYLPIVAVAACSICVVCWKMREGRRLAGEPNSLPLHRSCMYKVKDAEENSGHDDGGG